MDVAAWLRELGLERYAQAFLDNDIAPAVLPELTDQDLKELGVSLGHRRLLLKAIEELHGGRPVRAPASAPPEPAPRAEPERRQLTVMFIDLVGSTALSGQLDPEDLSAVIRAYQTTVADQVGRFEGHVAKFMGDGVLAYFGWPQAHEDDAERAVRSGLAMIEAVAGLATSAGQPLAARIGIATGLVMVGELIGEHEAQERSVVGETPNLAARLQALAAPGSVVISQVTRRLVGGLFELTDLGPTRLKGFAEPLAAFRVEGEGRADGRFEALHGERVTPLVGREHELAMLMERWAWAKDGDGQVVLIAGEPGIGKSRLLRALREALSGEPHVALSHFCSPYHSNSPLHPVIAQLQRAAGFAADDEASDKLARLEALLGQATEQLAEAAALISALLGLDAGERYPALKLGPQQQKQRTLVVLIDQLAGLARKLPVLELYEDLHWADPSTLELLDLLVERVRALPVLVVLTYRPEFSPPWIGQSHVTALTMNRLGRRQGAALALRITGGKALPAEVLDQILARTDGVPLFVEELTKTVLESDLLVDAGDRYELAGPLPSLAIPATLHDSLMARLDRLAPFKEVAQIGAVIGREFSHHLLAAVADRPEPELLAALDQLVAAELIFRRDTPPDTTYSFKHALVQDAAYQSLLKSKRQQLHARIAAVLEERFQRLTESEPQLLAHHYTQAGLLEPGISNWRKAGNQAIRRSANVEAVSHLRTALKLLHAVPETRERDELELVLHTEMGGPLVALRGYSDPECLELFSNARRIGERLGDNRKLLPALFGQWAYEYVSGRLPTALRIARDYLDKAQRTEDPRLRLLGHQLLGSTLLAHGQPGQALHSLRHAIEGFDPSRHARAAYTYGQNPRVVCLAYAGLALGCQGYADQALRLASEAVKEATDMSHFNTLAFALCHSGLLCLLLRDVGPLHATAGRLNEIAEEHAAPAWAASGRVMLDCARLESGAGKESLAQLHTNIEAVRAIGWHLFLPCYEIIEANAYGRLGDSRRGLRLLEEVHVGMEGTEQWLMEAEYHRVRAGLLSSIGAASGDTEAALARAIDIAQHQDARTFELRAATDLARLWRDRSRRSEAYDLLTTIYDWFTEDFETADLKDAKALLEELR